VTKILKEIPLAWRTAIVILILAQLVVLAFGLGLRWDRAVAMFPEFCSTMKVLAGIAAAKSGFEHASKAFGKPAAPAGAP
jgi:hypothetical protein